MTAVTEEDEVRAGTLVQVGPYIRPDQKERLRLVSFEQRTPGGVSAIVRQAIDEWFDRHTN